MPCYLLHMIEQPDRQAYDDTDLKDVVGDLPQLFCVATQPPQQLKPSEAMRCIARTAPCWDPKRAAAFPGPPQR